MSELEKWKKYWQDKNDPLHRCSSADHYQEYADELKVLLGRSTPKCILELGCGNGALYKHLQFDKADVYKGVDFSEVMLKCFADTHPNVDLECQDASAYRDENHYDLIFSNGLIQYFDESMLSRLLKNVRSMLKPGSRFICASILWKRQRLNYLTGQCGPKRNRRFFRGLYLYAKCILSGFPMGRWYDFPVFRKISSVNDMEVEFYGSMLYLYRIHAVMRVK